MSFNYQYEKKLDLLTKEEFIDYLVWKLIFNWKVEPFSTATPYPRAFITKVVKSYPELDYEHIWFMVAVLMLKEFGKFGSANFLEQTCQEVINSLKVKKDVDYLDLVNLISDASINVMGKSLVSSRLEDELYIPEFIEKLAKLKELSLVRLSSVVKEGTLNKKSLTDLISEDAFKNRFFRPEEFIFEGTLMMFMTTIVSNNPDVMEIDEMVIREEWFKSAEMFGEIFLAKNKAIVIDTLCATITEVKF